MTWHADSALTPAERLLLCSIRATTDATQLRQELGSNELDWPAFWDLAGQQHVQPLVARRLSNTEFKDRLPDEAIAELKKTRLETTVNNLASHAELASIASLFQEQVIPLIPLKGTDLAQRLFGGLDARRCGDIDILVSEEHWQSAYDLLVSSGYRPIARPRPGIQRHPFHGVPLLRTVNGRRYVVELHHQLSDPRFASIDHAALWRRALSEGAREDGTHGMPSEELLLFLALHLAKHDAGLLRLLGDIDHLVTKEQATINWQRVTTLAASWQVEALLYFSLESARTLLGTPVPAALVQELQPASWRRLVVPMLAGPRAILRPPTPERLRANRFRIAYCLMLAPARTMLRSYWHFIFAPSEHRAERSSTRWVRSIRRPFDGVARTTLAVGSAIRDHQRSKARHMEL